MATERKFTRFNPADRPMTTREIPEGGICLSAFLVINEAGHPERILMGHLDPSAPWDHIGALDPERAEANRHGWMLPSSHLMLGESPEAAAERILKEQLGPPMVELEGPYVYSEVYGAKNHWDLHFVFLGERDRVAQHPAWSELAFVDVNATPRDQIARYHEDILALVGRWDPARG
ncbi:MAG TPA: NUDIX hydrolase [Thermoplasmata archaeon]|jgi:ADP-ribose pyrophosphatase YjhB (NUDIX family)|nr:NUDIX hydrolase [Thermoplasmata archaeon]